MSIILNKFLPALIMLIVSAGIALAASQEWNEFHSTNGLSISYPSNWNKSDDNSRLDIKSSEGGAEGVSIAEGQAEINVVRFANENVSNFISSEQDAAEGDRLISRGPVKIGKICPEWIKSLNEYELGPNTYQIDTEFYCQANKDVILAEIINWKNDPRQAEYEAIGVQMIKTIRLTEERKTQ